MLQLRFYYCGRRLIFAFFATFRKVKGSGKAKKGSSSDDEDDDGESDGGGDGGGSDGRGRKESLVSMGSEGSMDADVSPKTKNSAKGKRRRVGSQ